jgi:hypothetical protein
MLAGVLLAMSVAAAPARAQSAPVIGKIYSSDVSDTFAKLNAEVNDGGASTHSWFEFGTNADMTEAAQIYERREPQAARNPAHLYAQVSLDPGHTYYWRFHVRTQWGEAVSKIMTVTSALPTPPPPGVRLRTQGFSDDAWTFTFSVDSRAPGTATFRWSVNKALTDGRTIAEDDFHAGVTELHARLRPADLPENVTIYVQCEAATVGGKNSAVAAFVAKRPASNF